MRLPLRLLIASFAAFAAFASFGCDPHAAPSAPVFESVRARLAAGDTRLLVDADRSAGTLTALRRVVGETWEAGLVELAPEQGELVVSATGPAGEATIERLSFTLAPIDVPHRIFGTEVALTDVRVQLATPIPAATTWTGDDGARLRAELPLELAWALRVEDTTVPLGAPDLPSVAVDLELGGDGAFVQADIRIAAGGALWSWANLVALHDLHLVLAAETP